MSFRISISTLVARKSAVADLLNQLGGNTPAAAAIRDEPGLAFLRRFFETGIAVRLSGGCARSRRAQPCRPRRLGKPSFRTSPKLGYERIATPGSRASSAGRSCPARRLPRDGPVLPRRYRARAVCAPIDRPTAQGPKLMAR